MVSIISEYGLYLYTGKVDMRKGIDGLCGIVSDELGHNPRKPKSVYVFSGRNPRVKKVLIREYNRYELTTIRLDEGRFIRPQTDLERRLAESDGRDRRMVEEFYRGVIEDMRKAQEKQMSDLRESMQRTIDGLTAQITALAASGKVNAGKLYGRKSERSSRLNRRRDDDDRNQGKDNFDGTAGSNKGRNAGSDDTGCRNLSKKPCGTSW